MSRGCSWWRPRELPAVEQAVASVRPDVVVVDSIQAVSDPELASPGRFAGPGASVCT